GSWTRCERAAPTSPAPTPPPTSPASNPGYCTKANHPPNNPRPGPWPDPGLQPRPPAPGPSPGPRPAARGPERGSSDSVPDPPGNGTESTDPGQDRSGVARTRGGACAGTRTGTRTPNGDTRKTHEVADPQRRYTLRTRAGARGAQARERESARARKRGRRDARAWEDRAPHRPAGLLRPRAPRRAAGTPERRSRG